MGIPKFFRSMSERYPLISQLIEENKIPEFDNLYLDMNGIIHNCSHPNDSDASFRLTESEMFLSIFNYIDHLFSKIKPKKLFFLAIDGVAPRAKMNQQRSRRFRTAKEAKELKEKAIRNGEELPKEDAFDSNCITPGTPFMALLSEQLKYFIAKKVTEDSSWRGVEVVLSGHETPGEGEHKIMEYIRLARSKPDYNPNTRHCMYGLDADLIMLGLLTHDPHFCLLREEVTFGPKKKSKSLDSTNFFLLHLSLLREYLDLEFSDLKKARLNGFQYDLENIIDDFILLNIFVGNDFLPHLPGLHINEGALPLLFDIYKRVLPQLDGYLNEGGKLSTKRLQFIIDELTNFEREEFLKDNHDLLWYKGKEEDERNKKALEISKAKKKFQQPVMNRNQKEYFDLIRKFLLDQRSGKGEKSCYLPPKSLESEEQDIEFLQNLARELNLRIDFDEYDAENDAMTICLSIDHHSGLAGSLKARNDMLDPDLEGDDEEADQESIKAIDRVLNKYSKAQVIDDESNHQISNDDQNGHESIVESEFEKKLREKMFQWKRDYYKHKLEFDFQDSEAMEKLAYRYIEGLQWVLHYYYDGVVSWGWFYDYHYSPKISDLKNVSKMEFNFNLGKPFKPFEQLMGVLPSLSAQHIPQAFRSLMLDSESPLKDFYPLKFEADLNGKKQDWEAVVKIPFIEEKRLLEALQKREVFLSSDEKERNSFKLSTRFTYDDEKEHFLPSSLKGEFPDLVHSRAKIEEFHLPTLEVGRGLIKGLSKGVLLGEKSLAGFPSLNTLPHTSTIQRHGVNVFQAESRGESIILHIQNQRKKMARKPEEIAKEIVGKKAFVNWPFLFEGMVVALSDGLFRYQIGWVNNQRRIVSEPLKPATASNWSRKVNGIERHYSKRYGVVIGNIDYLIHVRPLKGLKRLEDGALIKDYDENEEKEMDYPLQLLIDEVQQEDKRFIEKPPQDLSVEFPDGCQVFFLGKHLFGSPGVVQSQQVPNGSGSDSNQQGRGDTLNVKLTVFNQQSREIFNLKQLIENRIDEVYYPSFQICKICKISGLALSKLSSSMMVQDSSLNKKVNLGLNLKFESKGLKVLGYSRKGINGGWEFSQKVIDLVNEYKELFPEVVQAFLDNPHQDLTKDTDFFGLDAKSRMSDLKKWIKAKGVKELEAVSLFADQLDKPTIKLVEDFLTRSAKSKVMATSNQDAAKASIRKLLIKGLPRNAVLKPEHSVFKLQNQRFDLGDKVLKVSEVGSVPICANGVVVGKFSNEEVEVVFDLPFIGGNNLGGRCSDHRGAILANWNLLNLTNPQFVSEATTSAGASSTSTASAAAHNATPAKTNGIAASRSPRGPSGPNGGFAPRSAPPNPYRPPNHFKPNHTNSSSNPPQTAAVAGVSILNRHEKKPSKPQVSEEIQFAKVLDGKEKPSKKSREETNDLNPHLATLSLGTTSSSALSSANGNGVNSNSQNLPRQNVNAMYQLGVDQGAGYHHQQWQANQSSQPQPAFQSSNQIYHQQGRHLHPSAGNQLLQQLQSMNPTNSTSTFSTSQATTTIETPNQIVQNQQGSLGVRVPSGPSNSNPPSRGRGGGAPRARGGARGDFNASNNRGTGMRGGRGRGGRGGKQPANGNANQVV